MYCGSCLRDNAMATELIARGHDVMLLPVYTPTFTDEPNVSRDHVVLGGISAYLEQYVPVFRNSPRWLDRLWDSKTVLSLASRRSISTNPKMLGEMTVSVLKGEDGFQRLGERSGAAGRSEPTLHAPAQSCRSPQGTTERPHPLHAARRRSVSRQPPGTLSY